MSFYPQKESEQECRDFIRTGRCKFGESCKYNHPVGGIAAVCDPSEPLFPLRFGEKTCQYYLKHGFCKFGQSCKFHHPPNLPQTFNSIEVNIDSKANRSKNDGSTSGSGAYNAGSVVIVTQTTVQTLPQRPREPICLYYMRTGTCKFGLYCRKHHPVQDRSIREKTTEDVLYSPIRRDRRAYSIGSLLETGHSNVIVEDRSQDYQHQIKSFDLYSNLHPLPNIRERLNDTIDSFYYHNRNNESQVSHISNTSASLDLRLHDLSSSVQLTHNRSPVSSVVKSGTRGRSLSNNDLYNTKQTMSFYDVAHGNKTSTSADSSTYPHQPQSKIFFHGGDVNHRHITYDIDQSQDYLKSLDNENDKNHRNKSGFNLSWMSADELRNVETLAHAGVTGSRWFMDYPMITATCKKELSGSPKTIGENLWKYP